MNLLFGKLGITTRLKFEFTPILFGRLGITRPLESPTEFNVVWQVRIWYRISTDIIGYAKQVFVTDQDLGGGITFAKQYGEWIDR